MAITAIQPITNFSTVLPATAVSLPQELSVASDVVTTPTSSTIVTLGETQPLTQPLFDSSGNLVSPGTTARTSDSQALANELQTALTSSSASSGFGNISVTLNVSTTSSTRVDLSSLALEMSLLNASGLVNSNLLNAVSAAGTSGFSGLLATEVELALAGIGSRSGNGAASGALNANAIAVNNLVAATPTVASAPATPATVTVAQAQATVATATVPPAVAPAAIAPPATVPAATVPVATAPAVTASPTAIATPTPLPFATAVPGITPADVLQRLVADVTGRAVANLVDPGFAATSASLFASVAVFRASSLPAGTATVAGTPTPAVTAVRPSRAV